MKQRGIFQQNMHNYLAKLVLNHEISANIFTSLLILRAILWFTFINNFCSLQVLIQFLFISKIIKPLQIFILIFQFTTVMSLILKYYLNRKTTKRAIFSQKQKRQNYKHKDLNYFLQLTVKFNILIIKYILTIPVIIFFIESTKNNSHNEKNVNITLSVLNGIIYFGILYPLSGLQFLNKIFIKKNIVSYSHSINLESCIFVLLPIISCWKLVSSNSFDYVLLIFCFGSVALIFFRPIITFNFVKQSIYGVSMMIGVALASCLYQILNVPLNTPGQKVFYVFINLLAIYLFSQFINSRQTKILLSSKYSLNQNKKSYFSKDQCLLLNLLNLLNFNQNQNKLFLFFINNYQYLLNQQNFNPKKLTNLQLSKNNPAKYQIQAVKNEQNNQKNQKTKQLKNEIFAQEKEWDENQQNKRNLQNVLRKIFDRLVSKNEEKQIVQKNENNNSKQLQEMFYQLVYYYFINKFDLKSIQSQKLGQTQLEIKLSQYPNHYIFIIQLLILKNNSLNTAYKLLKIQQKLLEKVNNKGFCCSLEIQILLELINQQLKLKSKTNQQFNSKASNYLEFNFYFQHLNELIIQSSSVFKQFWTEISYQDKNQQKIEKLIEKNYYYITRVQSYYNKIITKFQGQCNLVIFSLISNYSQNILNIQIQNPLNPYKNIIKNSKNSLQQLIKKGYNKITEEQLYVYPLFQNYGVCMAELETEKCQILWGNQFFWKEFYCEGKEEKENKNKNKFNKQMIRLQNKPTLYDLMFPDLQQNHKHYIQDFYQNYQFNFKHQNILLHKKNHENSLYQQVNLEFQIIPTIKQGFRLSTFITRSSIQRQNYLGLILNQNLEFIAQTKQMRNQLSQLIVGSQKQTKDKIKNDHDQIKQLVEINQKRNRIKNRNGEENKLYEQSNILLDLQNSDYLVVLKRLIPIKNLKKIAKEPNYLFQLQLINILNNERVYQTNHSQNNKSNFVNQFKINKKFLTNFTTITTKQSFTTNFHTLTTSNRFLNICNSGTKDQKKNKQDEQIQKNIQIIVDNQILQQKNSKQQNLDKKFVLLNQEKAPKNITCWRWITMLLILLINGAILANILISVNHAILFDKSQQIIKNYNEVMSGTTEILIALRQYNYYAYTNGSQDSRIQSYVQQIKSKQYQIAQQIQLISQVLDGQWEAIQITLQGQIVRYKETSYIFLVNYILAPITFIAMAEPSQMQFSFLLSQFDQQDDFTPISATYYEAINNGLYNCLQLMITQRLIINQKISSDIVQFKNQYYLYPCVMGAIILLVFIIYSYLLQIRAKKVKKSIQQLLSELSKQVVWAKINSHKEYENRILNSKKGQVERFTSKQGSFNPLEYITKALAFHTKNSKTTKSFDNNEHRNSNYQNFLQIDKINTKVVGQEEQTKRQMKNQQLDYIQNSNESQRQYKNNQEIYDYENNIKQSQNSSPASPNSTIILNKKKSIAQKQSVIQNFKPLRLKQYSQFKILAFYLIICLPFFIYFIFIVIQGKHLAEKVNKYFLTSSQLYYRKNKFQNAYVWALETVFYEEEIRPDIEWEDMIKQQNKIYYEQQKAFSNYLKQIDDDSYLKDYLQSIQNSQLCKQIQKFSQIKYYMQFNEEQCQQVGHGILQLGLRPTIVRFLQQCYQMIEFYPQVGNLTQKQRIQAMQSQQISQLRIILGYLQQLSDLSIIQFQKDLKSVKNQYKAIILGFSIFTAILALGLLYSIYYRWRILLKQKKQMKSILNLISLKTIKSNAVLKENFQKINCQFYQ